MYIDEKINKNKYYIINENKYYYRRSYFFAVDPIRNFLWLIINPNLKLLSFYIRLTSYIYFIIENFHYGFILFKRKQFSLDIYFQFHMTF